MIFEKVKKRLVWPGLFILGLIVSIPACKKAGYFLLKDAYTGQADAMIVLMGSISDRGQQAFDLYNQGHCKQIIIVESKNETLSDEEAKRSEWINSTHKFQRYIIGLGVPEDQVIILPGDAASTSMEAKIVRDYLINHDELDTLILVSSSDHMRRSSMIFESAFSSLNNEINLFYSPSKYSAFNPDKWWLRKGDFRSVVMEYIKMVNYFVFERKDLRKEPATIQKD